MIRKTFLLAMLVLFCAKQASADNIFLTQFDFVDTVNGPGDVYTELANTLAAAGHTVTVADVRTGGTLAAQLASNSYDQVYLWDLTASLYLNAADTTALAAFWTTHSGLVVDTRSYGYYFQGANDSEQNLITNVAANFGLTGGGVWVGSDHDPDWTHNANAFLAAIGVNPITGNHSEPVNVADPTSVLLGGVTPTDLWGGGASIGSAPVGVQPNGIEMFMHFGHQRTDGSIIPYISASFDIQGPQPTPEPSSVLLLGAGLIGLAGLLRRRN